MGKLFPGGSLKLSAGIANLQISEAAESRLCWSGDLPEPFCH